MSPSNRSLIASPSSGRTHSPRGGRSSSAASPPVMGRPPLSCPIRRPSHRPGTEALLTWEELLGRR